MNKNYRKNVGIVVFNADCNVLMCARADRPGMEWQFPQGGIEAEENPLDAARRELREETGIVSAELTAVLPTPLRYDFPPEVLKRTKYSGRSYTGQEQSWFLFYFSGLDSEINFHTNPDEIEFKSYEWVDIDEAPKRIVSFKKAVYNEVTAFFRQYILNFKQTGKIDGKRI